MTTDFGVDTDSLRVPDDIARIIMTADNWDRVDDVIYPAGTWLRQKMPVGRGHVDGYDPVWISSKHSHIRDILKDLETYHSGDENFMLVTQEGDTYLRNMMGGRVTSPIDNLTPMDPPDHAGHRAAQADAFTVEAIRKYEDTFRELAKNSVENFIGTGGSCDAIANLTHHYPLRVIMQMMDVPESDFPLLERLTQETFGGDDPDIVAESGAEAVSPETAARLWQEAVDSFYDYFDEMVQDRLANPRADVATAIVQGRLPNGELMTPKRQNHMLSSLAIAGHDTVNAALAGGILGLARHPEQLALVKSDPSLIPGLVDESLRYGTPTKHFMRSATRDVDFHGVKFAKGDRIMVLLFSGNMDEDVFSDPESFDITRRPNPHLSFGFGRHICMGMHITKIEMRILFEELLPRINTLELDGAFRRKRGNFVTSIKTLPVRFTTP